MMRAYRNRDIKVNKNPDPKHYYKTRIKSLSLAGWEVKKETQWYTDMKKNSSSWFAHILIYAINFLVSGFAFVEYGYNPVWAFVAPLLINLGYARISTETCRILKPIK